MTGPVALYIHVPFCLSVCPYCNFVVYGGRAARGPTNRVAALVDALVTEIRLRAPSRRSATLRSVYLGGGTPSLLTAEQVAHLLQEVESAFGFAADAEITLECNPGPRDRGDLAGYRAAGVNRLSIGAQSLVDDELRRLGRRHSSVNVCATAADARAAGFDNVSLDLLYDVPGQTVASWQASLDAALALDPDHLSLYALALDGETVGDDHLPVTRGAAQWRRRAAAAQDEDRAADCYALADDLLGRAGFAWYEISNWARPGKESRHNLAYWMGEAYEGVGPGAHAFDGQRTRRWNAAQLEGYLAALAAGDLPPGGRTIAGREESDAERAILRLRTSAGLSSLKVGRAQSAMAWASDHGLIERTPGGAWRLNLEGRLLSNEVFVRLVPDRQAAAPR